jgi:hypothetical protein
MKSHSSNIQWDKVNTPIPKWKNGYVKELWDQSNTETYQWKQIETIDSCLILGVCGSMIWVPSSQIFHVPGTLGFTCSVSYVSLLGAYFMESHPLPWLDSQASHGIWVEACIWPCNLHPACRHGDHIQFCCLLKQDQAPWPLWTMAAVVCESLGGSAQGDTCLEALCEQAHRQLHKNQVFSMSL